MFAHHKVRDPSSAGAEAPRPRHRHLAHLVCDRALRICEFFREPEPDHILNIGPFTAGQVYCLPMLLLGIYMVWAARRQEAPEKAAV